MNGHRFDSAQVLSAIGAALGFALANFDRVAAAACAVGGLAYTLWKWRREARVKNRARFRALDR